MTTFSGLVTCLFIVVALIAVIIFLFYIVIPLISIIFLFVGRVFRFIAYEIRDVLLLPVAVLVGVTKVIRGTICIVLARWDMVRTDMHAAKGRCIEVKDRVLNLLIYNPLGIIGIDSVKKPEKHVAMSPRHRATAGPAGPKGQFAGYKIIGTLPSGGSGAKIYVAQPHDSSSTVVIKSFDISTGSALPQIVRESRSMEAAKKLGLIIEHHLDNEQFWYAMPHHAGDHLGVVTSKMHGTKARLSGKQIQTILKYQQSLLQTLREYHKAGLWHKDIKPDNIIIHNGAAHLVDLGLVTPLASAMTLTTHGTEYFRDPELVRQAMRGVKVHQVDGSRFDVFSTGAVLYYMLENTFPAHGGLSDFSKPSPEGIRWIVRRAMADYDKRYTNVSEMLADIETILSSDDPTAVRPADLPSMRGETIVQEPRHIPEPMQAQASVQARRLPLQSTPSTGGGPFKKTQYRTRPLGLIAMIVAIALGVSLIFSSTDDLQDDLIAIQHSPSSIFDHPQPLGKVLWINDYPIAIDPEVGRTAANFIAQLGAIGWDVVYDSEQEARVRSWLPTEPTANSYVAQKLHDEELAGILILRESDSGTLEVNLIEYDTTNTFKVAELGTGNLPTVSIPSLFEILEDHPEIAEFLSDIELLDQ